MDRDLIRARVAHHESGHAIIAKAVGLRVTQVRIRRSDGFVSLGKVDTDTYGADQADAELRFFYAGMYADARFLIEQGHSRSRALSLARTVARRHDLKQVRSISAWMKKHHNKRLNTRRAERDAERLVNRHWNAIARMAASHC